MGRDLRIQVANCRGGTAGPEFDGPSSRLPRRARFRSGPVRSGVRGRGGPVPNPGVQASSIGVQAVGRPTHPLCSGKQVRQIRPRVARHQVTLGLVHTDFPSQNPLLRPKLALPGEKTIRKNNPRRTTIYTHTPALSLSTPHPLPGAILTVGRESKRFRASIVFRRRREYSPLRRRVNGEGIRKKNPTPDQLS